MKVMKLGRGTLDDLAAYVADNQWALEQKMDGTRGLLRINSSGARWFSGNGKELKFAAATQHLPRIEAEIRELIALDERELWLDGEIMILAGEFRIFDCWGERVGLTINDPWFRRRKALAEVPANGWSERVQTVKSAVGYAAKKELADMARSSNIEGLVAKDIRSPYSPGVRSDNQRKLKFTATADVVVMEVHRPDAKHGWFRFGVNGDAGLVEIGRCSAIGKPEVGVGEVIEVAYQNWSGNRLIQPRMKLVRKDRDADSCGYDQFKDYSRETV